MQKSQTVSSNNGFYEMNSGIKNTDSTRSLLQIQGNIYNQQNVLIFQDHNGKNPIYTTRDVWE